jgi:hypothetical protein
LAAEDIALSFSWLEKYKSERWLAKASRFTPFRCSGGGLVHVSIRGFRDILRLEIAAEQHQHIAFMS